MSELPERLRDAVPNLAALVPAARPRRIGLVTNAAGEVAWREGAVWSLPEADGGPIVASWTTPEGFAPRFATEVVRAEAPAGEVAWRRPEDVLRDWRRGELLLDPASRAAIAPRPLAGVEVAFGVRALPLRTATLPPATHTNLYLVGHRDALIVDPGSAYPDELARLEAFLEDWRPLHGPPRGIFLTHHHADHTSGAALLRERTGLPILAHGQTAERVPFHVDRLVSEGDAFGDFEALHTPGHAPGHLCLWDTRRRLLLAGDMVASLGTIVIDPPDGDMTLYLASLRRLWAIGPRVIYPAHGEAITDPLTRLEAYRCHRLWREERLLQALPGPIAEVTRRAYTDVADAVLWLAERQALAHLLKLEHEGRIRCQDACWSPV